MPPTPTIHYFIVPSSGKPLWLELLPLLISIVAVAVSALVSYLIMCANRRANEDAAKRAYGQSILPSLIFYRTPFQTSYRWRLKNAGKGLAINVSVCNYDAQGILI